ncbi:MAG: hypothetical protein AAF409_01965 [Pseudomonadota bacterium]
MLSFRWSVFTLVIVSVLGGCAARTLPARHNGEWVKAISYTYDFGYRQPYPYRTASDDPRWRSVLLEQATDACPDGHQIVDRTRLKVLAVIQGFAAFNQAQFRVKVACTDDGARPVRFSGTSA